MSQSNPNSEPTMDEILASIRKIISEDQPEVEEDNAVQAVAPAPPAEPVAEEPAEMDMGEPISAEDVEPARSDPLSAGTANESLDAEDFDVPDIGSDAETSEEDFSDDEAFGGDFISPATRFALDDALERMEMSPEPVNVATRSDSSVEAVFARAVQDAFDPTLQEWIDSHGEEIVSRLTPLIREWMDKNLPSLVEAAVTKEISRAMRSRRR
jgi:cell pole-organizing protein PopZ